MENQGRLDLTISVGTGGLGFWVVGTVNRP